MYNPSLRQESRSQTAPIIPLQRDASILDWLEKSGRLLEREGKETDALKPEEEEEISALMGNEESDYDDDDDSDMDLED